VQADVLYKLIEDSAGLKGDDSEIVLDLFCGTGTIGLTLAKRWSFLWVYLSLESLIFFFHLCRTTNHFHYYAIPFYNDHSY
jgi:hypothetical protein